MDIKEIALKHSREYLTFKLGGRKGLDIAEIVCDDEIYAEIVDELAHQFEAFIAEIANETAEECIDTELLEIIEDNDKTLAGVIAHVEKQRDELLAVCKNFEIQGPDADDFVWLVLHGNGTTGKGMVNLGEDGMLVVQVAQCLETDRKAAIAGVKGEQ